MIDCSGHASLRVMHSYLLEELSRLLGAMSLGARVMKGVAFFGLGNRSKGKKLLKKRKLTQIQVMTPADSTSLGRTA